MSTYKGNFTSHLALGAGTRGHYGGASPYQSFAKTGHKANGNELLGLYGGLAGDLFSALGAWGASKTAKLNAQAEVFANRHNSEMAYLADLYNARMSHAQGVYDAHMMGLQGQGEKAALEHQEAMSALNAQRERLNLQQQADMARISAKRQLLSGKAARHAGDHEIARYTLRAGNQEATQRAALAANGVVMDEGSAQELQDSAALMRAVDVQTLRNNAINEAFGHESAAADLFSQAAMAEANRHAVMGQYYGSKGVRTQYSAPRDMSEFVTRQYVHDHSRAIRPQSALFNSLIGAAGNFDARWNSIYNKGKL